MTQNITHIKQDFSFLLHPTPQNIAEFISKVWKTLAQLKHIRGNDVVGAFDGDDYYPIVARFKKAYVNPYLTQGYGDFNDDGKFPKWGALCIKQGEPTQLYFGVFWEPVYPNVYHESIIIRLIPIECIIDCPIITDIRGIHNVAEIVANALSKQEQFAT